MGLRFYILFYSLIFARRRESFVWEIWGFIFLFFNCICDILSRFPNSYNNTIIAFIGRNRCWLDVEGHNSQHLHSGHISIIVHYNNCGGWWLAHMHDCMVGRFVKDAWLAMHYRGIPLVRNATAWGDDGWGHGLTTWEEPHHHGWHICDG